MRAEPSSDRIDVWSWRLGASEPQLARLIRLLSPDELGRAKRLAFAEHRTRFIVGRARLRQILARYLLMRPEAIRFNYGTHGKPLLSRYRKAPSFNLTHSGPLAALALSRCGAVGIDLEQLRPVGAEISLRFFTEGEKAVLAQLSGRHWLDAFYKCWTRKEAVLKADGKGLIGGLAMSDVALASDPISDRLKFPNRKPGSPPRWLLYDLVLDAGFAGTVAVRTDTVAPELRYFKLGRSASALGI